MISDLCVYQYFCGNNINYNVCSLHSSRTYRKTQNDSRTFSLQIALKTQGSVGGGL